MNNIRNFLATFLHRLGDQLHWLSWHLEAADDGEAA